MKIIKPAEKLIAYIEGPGVPFLYTALLFLAVVSLRNFLEIFAYNAEIPFKLLSINSIPYYLAWAGFAASLLHFYFFWAHLTIALGIIFFLITRENIGKIFKVIFSFFAIINLTPILDLLVTRGRGGADMSYAEPGRIIDLVPVPKGLTPGMICTSLIALALCYIYCRVKTNSHKKSIWAVFAVYILLIVLDLLPIILRACHAIHMIRAFMIFMLIEAAVLFYWLNKRDFIALANGLRWGNLFYPGAMFMLGILLVRPRPLGIMLGNLGAFLLALLAISLCWIAGSMFDALEDRRGAVRRLPATDSIPPNEYQKIALFLACGAAILGLGVNFQTFFFTLLLMGTSFIYSLPPLKFKRIPIFSKLCISLNSVFLIMLGYIFAGGELQVFPRIIIWYFLIFVTLVMNFMDIKDWEAYRQAGITTLPGLLGSRKARLLIGGLTIVSYAITSWLFLDPRLFVPACALGGVQFFLINKKNYREGPVAFTHLIGIVLLLIYLSIFGNAL